MTEHSAEDKYVVHSRILSSNGIGNEECFRLRNRIDIPDQNISANRVPAERDRPVRAMEKVKKHLREIRERVHRDSPRHDATIFHLQIVTQETTMLTTRIHNYTANQPLNVETTIADIPDEFMDVFFLQAENLNLHNKESLSFYNDLLESANSKLIHVF